MSFIKKGLVTFGATAALAGAFVATNTVNVEAAGWEARTVEEVEAGIETDAEETKYTIQWGDTLGTIATALDISVDQIVDMNEIADRDLIIAGNTLHLTSETVSIEDPSTQEVETFEREETEEPVEEVEEPVEEIEEAEEPAEEIEETVEEAEEPVEEAEETEEVVEEETTEETATEEETAPSQSGSEQEAKEWIAYKESTDNYDATNGQYIGKYQLSADYLDGDHSPENQEQTADEYVANRYGSWAEAKAFWEQNGWY